MPIPPGTKLGPYRIVDALGAGGMGEVYRARDTRLEREVAIKVLPEAVAGDADALGRFQREAKAVAALSHPNILALYDVGEDRGVAYAVTELLVGETLRAKLERRPLPPGQALDLACSIADGLSAAHEKDIVHRDLKPENVFVTTEGRVKILDFGLAKIRAASGILDDEQLATESRHTLPGTVLGTLGYMSPEQVRGELVDRRSDIFSFGAVLYEMLTGRRAFAGRSAADTMSAILREEPGESSRDAALIPPELERVLKRCLAKAPAQRYSSARDLRRELDAVPTAEPERASAPSIAVLPFVDMSPNRDQDYFCEGMAEELINGLTRIEGLRVAARSSAFQFKGQAGDVRRVGEALKVKAVLEGSVRTAGKHLRVTAQLNDASNGYQIWSKRYDRELEDVFEIQDQIASDIIDALQLQFGGGQKAPRLKRYTENLEAYHLYLQGRYHWFERTKGGLQRAMQYFERAIQKDPSYALAYCGLADLHSVLGLYEYVRPESAFAKAGACAERALSIDKALAEGHFSSTAKTWLYDFDWAGAERGFRRSLELNPSNPVAHVWYAHLMTSLGRGAEADRARERAQDLDPLSPYINAQAALNLVCERRDTEALVHCRKVLDVEPAYLVALFGVGLACARLGRHDEAVGALERAVSLADRACFHVSLLGSAYALAGRAEAARQVLGELEQRASAEYVSPLFLAWVEGALGDTDRAFEHLENAYRERSGYLVLPGFAPFDALRADPRFERFVRRMGLVY